VTTKTEPRLDKTRPRLLAAGWILLALSLLLCVIGPRLTANEVPSDIGNSMGDMDWAGMGWIIGGMIVGALALMCFVAQWVLRPRRINSAHRRESAQSK
jgi:hypothetical protein